MKFFTPKKILAVVVVAAAVGGGLWYRSTKSATVVPQYALGTVSKETLVSSIQGTGQVSGNQEIEVKPEATAKIVQVLVKVGEDVKEGTPLAELDRSAALKTVRDAAQSVRDSELSLQSARLQFQKTQKPADRVSLIQAQNSVDSAKRALATLKQGPTAYELKQAEADLESSKKNIRMTSDNLMPLAVRNAYDDQVLVLQSAVQTLEKSLIDADNVLGIDNTVNGSQLQRLSLDSTKRAAAENAYLSVKDQIKSVSEQIKNLKLANESVDTIEQMTDKVIDALQDANSMLIYVADSLRGTIASTSFTQSQIDSLKSNIDSDRNTITSKITSVSNQVDAIDQAKENYQSALISYQKVINSYEKLKAGPETDEIASAEDRVEESEAQLQKLKETPDPVDVQMGQNSIEQRISALNAAKSRLVDANETLNDYTVRAPLDGIVAALPAKVGVDAGASIATIVTAQKIATISLNEVDVAKVKVGQKATLTFDAIENLTISGEVAQVNPVGTVSQGVVSYGVQIAFDSQDDRIRSGMSVSATIITQIKRDVLAVPNSAVKTLNGQSYVEIIDSLANSAASSTGLIPSTETPRRIQVETGLSTDTMTEITSGLAEGEHVITQTITGVARTTTNTTQNNLRIPGLTGGAGGGNVIRAGGGGGPTFIGR